MSRGYAFGALILLLALGGCSLPGPIETPPKAGGTANTWSVGCRLSIAKAIGTWWHGKQSWRVDTPCQELLVASHHIVATAATPKAVPDSQSFRRIAAGRVANWSWELAATPQIARDWGEYRHAGATPVTDEPQVSWPALFKNVYDVYRYVLAAPPPKTRFSMFFFPNGNSLERTRTTPTDAAIVLPFFVPYKRKGAKWSSSSPDSYLGPWRSAYFMVNVAAGFEYIHALFFTKRLKVPNLLGQSVAGKLILQILTILDFRGPGFEMTLPSADASLKLAQKEKSDLLRRGAVDKYGGLLAAANAAIALGGKTKSVTIHAGDRRKLLRLLKLARAMLQKPVNFMDQPLYPVERLDSIPDYTGTKADAAGAR